MFSFANRKFVLAISATALLAGVSFTTTPASAYDRYVGGGMWAHEPGTTPANGYRPIGGCGNCERLGGGRYRFWESIPGRPAGDYDMNGKVPVRINIDDRPVGGGMYEKAGTGTTPNGDRPVGGGMYEKAGTGTTPNGDRPVGGGMYEKVGTGTTPNGDRPVGGGMYEKGGTGTTPNGDRPVGGGMYEKAGTSTASAPAGKSVGLVINKPAVVVAKTPTTVVNTKVGALQITTRPTVMTPRANIPAVRTPTITPVVHTTIGAMRIATVPTPAVRIPTITPTIRR